MQHGYDCPCPACAQRRAEWEEDERKLSRETERGHWQRQAARVAESEREEEEARRNRR